jgi:hypothetical protein
MSYLLEPDELVPEEEPEPLEGELLDVPPDWPWMLPEALAPVPALSWHSFGIALFDAYFDSSQRVSFCPTCDLFEVELVGAAEELVVAPALVLLGVDCMPLVVFGAPEPDGFWADWLLVVVDEDFLSLARSPRARAEPLARANRAVNNTTGALLRIGGLHGRWLGRFECFPRCGVSAPKPTGT